MLKLLLGLVGITGLVVAAGLLIGGGSLLWVDTVLTDQEGFINSTAIEAEVDGYALVVASTDVDLEPEFPVDFELATFRLQVENQSASQGIFVGIAPTPSVEDYLEGVPHAIIEDLGSASPPLEHRSAATLREPERPVDQDFWLGSAAGTGTQELRWEIQEGEYAFVVMNEDASDGMSFDVVAGVRIPVIRPVSVSLLIGGALVLSLGTVFLALAL